MQHLEGNQGHRRVERVDDAAVVGAARIRHPVEHAVGRDETARRHGAARGDAGSEHVDEYESLRMGDIETKDHSGGVPASLSSRAVQDPTELDQLAGRIGPVAVSERMNHFESRSARADAEHRAVPVVSAGHGCAIQVAVARQQQRGLRRPCIGPEVREYFHLRLGQGGLDGGRQARNQETYDSRNRSHGDTLLLIRRRRYGPIRAKPRETGSPPASAFAITCALWSTGARQPPCLIQMPLT